MIKKLPEESQQTEHSLNCFRIKNNALLLVTNLSYTVFKYEAISNVLSVLVNTTFKEMFKLEDVIGNALCCKPDFDARGETFLLSIDTMGPKFEQYNIQHHYKIDKTHDGADVATLFARSFFIDQDYALKLDGTTLKLFDDLSVGNM